MSAATGSLRPGDLPDLVGIPLSPDQVAAATAALEPGVIVAGAGSGKTTVMAARVVWLVATGQVRPDQVLGLTFTNKAAASLLTRVRTALAGIPVLGQAAPPGTPGGTLADPVPGPLPDLGGAVGDGPQADTGEPQVSTYHSFASALLTEHGLRLGVEPGSRLLVDAGRHQLAYRMACAADLPLDDLDVTPVGLCSDVLALDDALAELAVAPADLIAHDDALLAELAGLTRLQAIGVTMQQTARCRRVTAMVVDRFRQAKAERALLDFADQVRLAHRVAQECPEVGVALRDRYRVVLLDEYQDTSVAQRLMLQALFAGGHPVTAVGDPCQAIYGWRGASVHNIDAFPEHFPRVDGSPAVRYSLVENRRSGPRILDLANEVSRPLREEHPGVRPLAAAASGKGAGALRCALLTTAAEEIDWVADRVAEAGAAGRWRDVAVLIRVASDAAALQQALAERAVPTQVVGTTALLSLPEVVELRSVLEVLHDPTANPALLRLLTGPRWAIGPRDLAALGRRAADLAGQHGREDLDGLPLADALDRAVAGADPVEVVSLADAMEDPGDAAAYPLSPQARERLAALAAEIRGLRRHVAEPLVDLVHRVLARTGLDVELAAAPEPVAASRAAAVAAFADLAADFRDLSGQVTLGAFLAWLRDAERFDASPTAPAVADRDAVIVMTIHKAKGLEFPVVVLPSLVEGVFPSSRGRGRWPASADVVPPVLGHEPVPEAIAAFPDPAGPRKKDYDAFVAECRRLDRLDETRLAYVAFTRAERLLIASGHRWGPTQIRPREPSDYLVAIRDACLSGGGPVDTWAPEPVPGDTNPALAAGGDVPWPVTADPAAWARRVAVAEDVRRAAAAPAEATVPAAGVGRTDDAGLTGAAEQTSDFGPLAEPLTPAQAEIVAGWDHDIDLLIADLQRERRETGRRVVRVPDTLSTTALLRLAADPDGFARDLARPMPRRPAPAARRGIRFHAWLESRLGQQPLLAPDDLPGAADDDIDSDAALDRLREAFLATEYADRVPHAVEAAFDLVLAGRVVRGRIDAVFGDGDGDGGGSWEVVDWKTGSAAGADPLQLAVYRLAWAERVGEPVERVGAAFVIIRTGQVIRPSGLPDRAGLEALLGG